ncbi:putative DNA-binding domain, KAT8 regulatory NSL complex subunit 2 [Helianthus anomalus]
MDPPPSHHPFTTKITTNSASIIKQSPEDEYLSNSTHLSRQQVLNRRSHNMQQLSKCYRDHYWGLMEEIRVRYREYLWKFGVSPFQDDCNEDEKVRDGIDDAIVVAGDVTCVFNGCKTKAMTLTSFCHVHILSDPKQQLYKPCEFLLKRAVDLLFMYSEVLNSILYKNDQKDEEIMVVYLIKRLRNMLLFPTNKNNYYTNKCFLCFFCMFSVHAGLVPCGKPVLRSIVPSLCSIHYLKAQQHVVRALRKAGLNITSMNKSGPKFHVVVTEYVREIQEKRKKNGSMANKKKIVPKLEIEN